MPEFLGQIDGFSDEILTLFELERPLTDEAAPPRNVVLAE
jgi:hypothetical protein